MKNKIIILLVALFVLALAAPFAIGAPSLTNFTDHVHILTTGGTATPGLMVNQRGTGAIFELRDNGTPVARMPDGGGWRILSGAFVLGQQSETVTATFVITPTAPYISMTSNAAYTSSTTTPIITTTGTAGQLLVLQNNNAGDALIVDGTGGTVECKADVTLAAGDTLTLIYNAADLVWNCLAGYDNSP